MWETIRKILKCITVEPVLFMYMMIIFLESNALQELILVKSCLKLHNPVNISNCSHINKTSEIDVVEEAAYWVRFNGAFLFFFTFLSSFFVASWSDKFGRKFPMIIPPVGTLIAACINCCLSVFINSHISYFFISSVVSGITFGSVGIISSTFGFITDISDESSRTKRMMILEATIYAGGTIGIYIAGEFLKNPGYDGKVNNFANLFIFESSVAAIIGLYILLRIPNRTGDKELLPPSWGNLFMLDHVKDSMKIVVRARSSGKRKMLLLLLLALFFIYFGLVVQFTLAYYFVKSLSWEFHDYSIYNSILFAVEGITLLCGMPLVSILRLPDYFVAGIGIISKLLGYTLFGLSYNNIMVYSCIVLFMFSEYPVPAIRSMLSKIVDADEKGRIFAFATILQNFCFLIGSFTLTSIFKQTESFFPGLSFEIVAFMQGIALIIILYLYFTRRQTIVTYEVMEDEDGSIQETCSVSEGSIN